MAENDTSNHTRPNTADKASALEQASWAAQKEIRLKLRADLEEKNPWIEDKVGLKLELEDYKAISTTGDDLKIKLRDGGERKVAFTELESAFSNEKKDEQGKLLVRNLEFNAKDGTVFYVNQRFGADGKAEYTETATLSKEDQYVYYSFEKKGQEAKTAQVYKDKATGKLFKQYGTDDAQEVAFTMPTKAKKDPGPIEKTESKEVGVTDKIVKPKEYFWKMLENAVLGKDEKVKGADGKEITLEDGKIEKTTEYLRKGALGIANMAGPSGFVAAGALGVLLATGLAASVPTLALTAGMMAAAGLGVQVARSASNLLGINRKQDVVAGATQGATAAGIAAAVGAPALIASGALTSVAVLGTVATGGAIAGIVGAGYAITKAGESGMKYLRNLSVDLEKSQTQTGSRGA